MRHRKDEPGFYCDSELRKMRSDDIPEMYLALRKINIDIPAKEIIDPIITNKAFRQQVDATIRRFYSKEQIEKWEGILRIQEEDTKEGEYKELIARLNPPIPYKARKMPFPIRWFGNGWKALRRKK